MENCKILRCTCEHTSQDNLHGRRMRVHNITNTKSKDIKYQCTVCGDKK